MFSFSKYVLFTFLFWLIGIAQAEAKIYAVVVGVSDYQYDAVINDLRYSDDDAFAMAAYLTGASHEVVRLTDGQATKANILRTAAALFAKATSQDVILFFFSGHGAEGVFIPHDFDGKTALLHSEVKALFKQSKAGLKVCIADACHSGSIKLKIGTREPTALQSNADVVIMMSSRANEVSQEQPRLGKGVFTHFLLMAFQGNADVNRDRKITLLELFNYLSRQVSQQTNQKQHPIMFGRFNKEMAFVSY
jgi:uncharacterized caspase-like protein